MDGRWFPWGNRFDPSQCNMRDSMRGRPGLVTVDEFPSDVSVYGVRGMGGNVRDWTATEVTDGTGDTARLCHVERGGAWSHFALSARAANRAFDVPTGVYDGTGFRWVRTAAPTTTRSSGQP